jgi:hypothetical protein
MYYFGGPQNKVRVQNRDIPQKLLTFYIRLSGMIFRQILLSVTYLLFENTHFWQLFDV